jgi:hypothetical protein
VAVGGKGYGPVAFGRLMTNNPDKANCFYVGTSIEAKREELVRVVAILRSNSLDQRCA